VNRCYQGRNLEHAVELLVDVALDERHDAIGLARLDISDGARRGEVERAVAEPLDGSVVIFRNDELDRHAERLGQIKLERFLFLQGGRRGCVRHDADPDEILGWRRR
jgi:hypothetical protein